MKDELIGIKLVRMSNAIRRMTFNESIRSGNGDEQPTGTQEMFLAYMSAVEDQQEILQKDLEGWFNIRRSTATEILKRMEQKGLITREPVSYDRRVKKILLTEKAHLLCEENFERILVTENKLIQGFTNEEIQEFLRLLAKMQQNIE